MNQYTVRMTYLSDNVTSFDVVVTSVSETLALALMGELYGTFCSVAIV